jgi:hypothetical protein
VVRGTTSDNGEVKQVVVNGVTAKPQLPNFAEWEVTVPIARADAESGAKLRAHAADAAGNTEPRGHEVTVR